MCVQSPWEKALEFHGHVCPGLVLGFRAAEIGLRELGLELPVSHDANLVCLTENKACAVDAIQAVTGCTLGKANLVVLDYGKLVFTFARRDTAEAVRVVVKPFDFGLGELRALQDRILQDAGESSRKAFSRRREEISDQLMEMVEAELFEIRRVTVDLPPEQRVKVMVACSNCGEGVFEEWVHRQNAQVRCAPCAGH